MTCSVPGGGDLTRVSVGIIIGRLMGSFRPGDYGIYTRQRGVYTTRHKSDTLGRGWPVTRFVRALRICTDQPGQGTPFLCRHFVPSIVSPIFLPRVRSSDSSGTSFVRSQIVDVRRSRGSVIFRKR